MLWTAGYEVHQAHDASAALELLARHPVDLVVADVMMPGMDGLELAEEIRRRSQLSTTKVLAVSAAPEHIVRAKGDSFDAFLPKPFSAHALLEQVGFLIDDPP